MTPTLADHRTAGGILAALLIIAGAVMAGCEVDSFFDPSRTGHFQHTPTMVPILERLDVIEEEERPWGHVTGVQADDLRPSDLTYVLGPGDFISVEIFELYEGGRWTVYARRIDAAGRFRIPEIGDLVAAGKTVQEFEDDVRDRLAVLVMPDPVVNVVVEEGRAFTFTIYGHLANPAVLPVRDPDLRLLDALAFVGGVPITTETIYVIRQVPLTEDVLPRFDRERPPAERPRRPDRPEEDEPVDVDELIEQLRDRPEAQPGMIGEGEPRLVDVDEVAPARVSDQPAVDVDELRERAPRRAAPPRDETFIYVEERDEWVRVRQPDRRPDVPIDPDAPPEPEPEMILERIVEIPYERLARGESRFNIVVRPNDRIFVEGPPVGMVYISGEIARPGVFQLPRGGGRLTLSRLVAAAGDLGPIAQPERVDVTRVVGEGREATIRVNLAAIRRRTEPDIYIKPDDHIHIGTSWIATPLAIIRNGFRTTYGFGFLLDRNFGNDVFGPPPVSRVQFQ